MSISVGFTPEEIREFVKELTHTQSGEEGLERFASTRIPSRAAGDASAASNRTEENVLSLCNVCCAQEGAATTRV
jgi:hypothetical protein